jgi:hypothetical protein
VTNLAGCFEVTNIQSIPSNLFQYNSNLTSIGKIFAGTYITSIPERLFENNTRINSIFYNSSIDYGFNDTRITEATSGRSYSAYFSSFGGCKQLVSVPSDLFSYTPNVSNFNYAFSDCTSLSSIPSGLFANNTAVTDFSSCFTYCTSLSSIPNGLFDHNINVTSFYNCFSRCSRITSIPDNLFAYNTAVTMFSYCLDYTGINDFTLHIGSPNVTSADICRYKSGTTRIVYVPSGSTSQTTFNSIASSLGLTIIGE